MQAKPNGKYYDEFKVGDKFVTPSRTVTETDIVNFAGLSGDYNQVHTDEEFAKNLPFKGRIAHGLLTLAITSGLVARAGLIEGTTIAFLGQTNKFLGPVKPGDTITCHVSVVDKKDTKKPDRGVVFFKFTVTNQRQEAVMEAEQQLMMYRKPS